MKKFIALALVIGTIASPAADKKDVAHQAIQAHSGDASQSPLPSSSVIVNITGPTQTIDHACHPADCNHEPEHWLDKFWSDPVATFTGFLFIATLGLIGTGLIQWRAMRDQEKTTRIQTRAYLGIKNAEINLLTQNHIQANVEVANTGQTPARSVTQAITLKIMDSGDTPSFAPVKAIEGQRPIVPGASWMFRIEQTISDEERKLLIDKKKVIYVWGRGEYVDVFDKSQSLDFRYQNLGQVIVGFEDGTHKLSAWALYPEKEGNDST